MNTFRIWNASPKHLFISHTSFLDLENVSSPRFYIRILTNCLRSTLLLVIGFPQHSQVIICHVCSCTFMIQIFQWCPSVLKRKLLQTADTSLWSAPFAALQPIWHHVVVTFCCWQTCPFDPLYLSSQQMAGFKPPHTPNPPATHHLPAVCPWANCLTSLHFSSLSVKWG